MPTYITEIGDRIEAIVAAKMDHPIHEMDQAEGDFSLLSEETRPVKAE